MTRLMLAVLLTAFAIGSAAAQAPGTCESKAIREQGDRKRRPRARGSCANVFSCEMQA